MPLLSGVVIFLLSLIAVLIPNWQFFYCTIVAFSWRYASSSCVYFYLRRSYLFSFYISFFCRSIILLHSFSFSLLSSCFLYVYLLFLYFSFFHFTLPSVCPILPLSFLPPLSCCSSSHVYFLPLLPLNKKLMQSTRRHTPED